MSPITSATGPNAAGSQSASSQTSTAGSVDKNMFLQLLIAQLKNQDPLKPTDGIQYVQQLAQYEQLEQSINTGQDVAAIRADLAQLGAIAAAAKTTQS